MVVAWSRMRIISLGAGDHVVVGEVWIVVVIDRFLRVLHVGRGLLDLSRGMKIVRILIGRHLLTVLPVCCYR